MKRRNSMLDCISVQNMRDSDAYTIANFVPGLELMHRAAMGVFLAHDWQGSAAIVCGSGNNGGDGFALACILQERGFDSAVFAVSERLSADSAHYAEKARNLGIPIAPFASGCLAGFDTVVDCLLGTGFAGTLRENYRAAIEAINESGAFVLSVDINSGMNGDTGAGETNVRRSRRRTGGAFQPRLPAAAEAPGATQSGPAQLRPPDLACLVVAPLPQPDPTSSAAGIAEHTPQQYLQGLVAASRHPHASL